MAKNDKSTFAIKPRETVPVQPGKYETEVKALADADGDAIGANTIDILIPTTEVSDRGRYAGQDVDATGKYKREFQRSARALGFTAVNTDSQDQGDGTTILVFALAPVRTRTHKVTGDDTELDVPDEDTAA